MIIELLEAAIVSFVGWAAAQSNQFRLDHTCFSGPLSAF
ncbi:hypothetical protein XMD579_000606 [Marinobacterium sp. xm-d-579]|nr:hypothetical protein [Marinobacterium sp. xm-d-579]